jgi:hypothetical protein
MFANSISGFCWVQCLKGAENRAIVDNEKEGLVLKKYDGGSNSRIYIVTTVMQNAERFRVAELGDKSGGQALHRFYKHALRLGSVSYTE